MFNPNIVARDGFIISSSAARRVGDINFIQINFSSNAKLTSGNTVTIADIKGIKAPMIRGAGSTGYGGVSINGAGGIQYAPSKDINANVTLYAQFVVLAQQS